MLKFAAKHESIHFTRGWITSQKDMMCDGPEEESLAQMTGESRFNAIIKVISEQERDSVADYAVLF